MDFFFCSELLLHVEQVRNVPTASDVTYWFPQHFLTASPVTQLETRVISEAFATFVSLTSQLQEGLLLTLLRTIFSGLSEQYIKTQN